MKLFCTFRIYFAATLGLVFLLSSCCIAGGNDNQAGSSVWRPRVPQGPIYTVQRPREAETYIRLLDPKRIQNLTPRPLSMHLYPKEPFYIGMPIFTVDTDVPTVEQALRDFRYVGIVDPVKKQARRIKFTRGRLEQDLFEDPDKVLLLQSLDPNIHILYKHLYEGERPGVPIQMPPELDVEDLPHYKGDPVLVHSRDSLGEMLRASNTETHRFWHVRENHPPVLIRPRMPAEGELARVIREDESNYLTSVLTMYMADRLQFGDKVASIRHGAPIHLSDEHLATRLDWTHMMRYPRFGRDATRPQMIHALQKYGRFRLYDTTRRGKRAVKVVVENPSATEGVRMELSAKELSEAENKVEAMYEALGRIHRPF